MREVQARVVEAGKKKESTGQRRAHKSPSHRTRSQENKHKEREEERRKERISVGGQAAANESARGTTAAARAHLPHWKKRQEGSALTAHSTSQRGKEEVRF